MAICSYQSEANRGPSPEAPSLCACGTTEASILQEALDNMPQGLCMFDPSRRVAVCNSRYAEIVDIPAGAVRPGVTLRELLELSVAAGHFPGKSADEVECEFWPSLESGAVWHSIFHRNGRDFSITQRVTEGGFRVAAFEEVTEKLAAERALREGEAQLRAILDAIPDCVKIFDEAGKLVYINPAGLDLLQAPDFESLGRPDYVPVMPDCLHICVENHLKVISGESAVYYYEIIGLEGRQRDVEAHAVPLRMPDGSRAQLCISRDITERSEAEEALRRSEERLRLLHEATGLADFETGADGVAIVSDRLLDQIGLPHGDNKIPFDRWLEVVHPADRDRFREAVETSFADQEQFLSEFRIVRQDTGETRWMLSHTRMERDAVGVMIRTIGGHLDITERKRVEEALRESEERFRLATEASDLGVWDYDSSVERQQWSERFREILGIPAETEPDLSVLTQLIHPEDRAALLDQLFQIRGVGGNKRLQGSFRIHRGTNRAERWIALNGWKPDGEAGEPSKIIITIRDITDERTSSERIRWAATHDALTGLPNRRLFHERLELAIENAKAKGNAVGLLLLDLDQFKQINDTLGHSVGDALLETFADRLRSAVRSCDTVARLGGDEFAVVLPEIEGSVFLEEAAAAIFDRFREPLICDGTLLECRSSVGASLFPNHGQSTEELLKHADIALYSAKSSGRGRLTLFHSGLLEEVVMRNSMISLGKLVVKEDLISPFYQPEIDLNTNEIVGFEALLRWRDRDGAVQSPERIAAAFDDPEVATAISDRMLERSITDMRGWLDKGIDFKSVAFNASAAEFRRGGFAEGVLEQLDNAGVPSSCLQIEVTETVFLGRGAEYVLTALKILNSEGVKIALDDFGTGYASLRHLKEFPVEIIKIDQSFVRNMVVDPGDEAIVRAVINLGQSLGMKVVAEGIESIEQARRLLELGCDFGQGYLFSKAVPADKVPDLISFSAVRTTGRLSLPRQWRPRLGTSNT